MSYADALLDNIRREASNGKHDAVGEVSLRYSSCKRKLSFSFNCVSLSFKHKVHSVPLIG